MKNQCADKRFQWKYIYYAMSVLSLLLIVWVKQQALETNLPPLKPFTRLVINFIYLNLAVSFYTLVRKPEKSCIPPATWIIFAGIGALLCTMLPVFSGDLMEYLARGRILGVYHLSPYSHTPSEFPGDLFFPYTTWKNNPDSYGPLNVLMEALPAVIFKNSVAGAVWFEKMILMAFMALGIFFFVKLMKQSGLPARADLTALFALNPLLLVSTLIDGHNDTAMMSLTIASAYFLLQKRYTRSFALWTLAFLIKYTVLLVLPFWIAAAVKEEWKTHQRFPWFFILREAAVNGLIIFAAFAPLWGGRGTFLALIRASEWFYTNTLPYAFRQGFLLVGWDMAPVFFKFGALSAFFVIYLILLWRFWTKEEFDSGKFFRTICVMYLCFYVTITIPFGIHYLLWALPWLVLSRWPLERFLITLYSFTGLFSYFKRMNYLILAASAVYLAVLAVSQKKSGETSS